MSERELSRHEEQIFRTIAAMMSRLHALTRRRVRLDWAEFGMDECWEAYRVMKVNMQTHRVMLRREDWGDVKCPVNEDRLLDVPVADIACVWLDEEAEKKRQGNKDT